MPGHPLNSPKPYRSSSVRIPARNVSLDGDLVLPEHASGLVVFAHGSGSSRLSSRNRAVASELQAGGLATLLLDLLTPQEERVDMASMSYRFDIPLLASRLVSAVDWAHDAPDTRHLPIPLFGASTGAAAALVAAAVRPELVRAVVSRGGRPDLAGESLANGRAPTLLIRGGLHTPVTDLNRPASRALRCIGDHHCRRHAPVRERNADQVAALAARCSGPSHPGPVG